MTMDNRMKTQSAEFDAMERLAAQWRRITMTPVVDDNYPEVRHGYESALRENMIMHLDAETEYALRHR